THLPNTISTQVHSLDDLLRGLRLALEGRPLPLAGNRDRRELVGRYVANASGPLAAARIAQVLSDLHDARPKAKPETLAYLNAWSRMTARQSLTRLRDIVRRDRNLHDYMDQKFPGLSLQEVQDQLRAISLAGGHGELAVAPRADLHCCYTISAVGRTQATREQASRREPLMTA